ncbi:MAG: leucine-rich repeat domain-containing protein [Bacteroidetes bacterium]|nr:leucine-rich repeat domain-containing protein [Bacteroidota bacterium]
MRLFIVRVLGVLFFSLVIQLHSFGDTKKFTSLEEAKKNPENVVILDLDNKGLIEFPEEIFGFPNLKVLYLNSNLISEIPENIGSLDSLKELYLSSNFIRYLPIGIGDLKNLQTLDLSYSQLEEIPGEIGNLKNLEILKLCYSLNLDSLPDQIGELGKLWYLNLSVTGIKKLPPSIRKLNGLLELIMSQTALAQIPEGIIYLKKLKLLEMNENSITEIPDYICELENLEKLLLSSNKIGKISPSIGRLGNLNELRLDNNKIQQIPVEIFNLQNLNKLDLSRNEIQILPNEIGKLTKLRYLNLSHNRITIIPPEIGRLTELKELYLWMNDAKLPDEILQLTLEEIDFIPKFQMKLKEVVYRENSIRQWRNTFIAGCIVLLAIVIVIIISNIAIRRSRSRLRTTIIELKETQHKLIESEKMAALGTLVSRVAHEVNTPVGVGVTTSSTVLNQAQDILDDYQNKKMTRKQLEEFITDSIDANNLILSNLRSAHSLIQSFKQVSVDQVTDELRQFNMNSYLYDIINSIQPKLNPQRISVSIDCPQHLEITSYPGVWSQIIINLALNSLMHGFRNRTGGRIKIRIEESDGNMTFTFEDNGHGIDENILPKVFDPFFTTDRQSGTGLGLNIVYNLVTQKLNGTIQARNLVTGGVAFIVRWKMEK